MGRNKQIRKDIAGWERAVRKHEKKIEIESAEPIPNSGRIAHWEAKFDLSEGR